MSRTVKPSGKMIFSCVSGGGPVVVGGGGVASSFPPVIQAEAANAPTATRTDEARNDHDWGWVGLIGQPDLLV